MSEGVSRYFESIGLVDEFHRLPLLHVAVAALDRQEPLYADSVLIEATPNNAANNPVQVPLAKVSELPPRAEIDVVRNSSLDSLEATMSETVAASRTSSTGDDDRQGRIANSQLLMKAVYEEMQDKAA